MKKKTITLDGQSLTLDAAEDIAAGANIAIDAATAKRVELSRNTLDALLSNNSPIYGVNTGFGSLAQKKIPAADLIQLQSSLLKSHAAGWGPPLDIGVARLALALRLNVLLKGNSGVTLELCKAFEAFLQHDIIPVIPSYGSVGASGDLAPLAHLALPLIGESNVHYKGKVVSAKEALSRAGISPYKLREKEGLALINGTQIMGALGGLALAKGIRTAAFADLLAALSLEALEGCTAALDPLLHHHRGQKGQILSAQTMRSHLESSYLHEPHFKPPRVQDPYSLRCAPQVHGASRDALSYAAQIVEIELNASTDNPLIFSEDGRVVNGGNFHGQPLALAFDFAAIALAELGNISERRLELLLNPTFSRLPVFLTPEPGVCSGYMAIQYLSASLVNENKLFANPASTDSIPGNTGVEDHVSMGMTSAHKLSHLYENLLTIQAAELLAAAQAIDLRRTKNLGKGTKKLYHALRAVIPMLKKDRIVAEDIAKARALIAQWNQQ